MKNIIKTNILKPISISLSILSAQTLFAQVEYKVTGCRLQVAGTNQTTNYELKNRLEEVENQPAGCRLQKVEGSIINEGEYNLETEIETDDFSQYTLPQNVFSEPLRTVKVCSGSVKTILEQSPYEISSTSIPVSRYNDQALLLEKDPIPISNLPSSISYFGVTPKLMMDSAKLKNIEEGIEDMKGVFGFLGETPSAKTHSLVESSSSSGIASVKPETESAASTLIVGETAEENSTNAFLEQEICNNIYTSCFAKVAKVASMSLAEHTSNSGESIFGFSQESRERIVTEQKAKNDVEKRQQENQAQAIAYAKTRATQLKEQAATAKVASETTKNKGKHDDVEGDAWRKVVFKLEQASESWNKVSETLTQGNQKIASLWKKAAEKDSVSAEKFEQLALAYALEDEVEAEKLNKFVWIAYHLSNADRWLAESEEALEKGHQDIAEFWRKAAMDDQKAAENWKQAVEAYALGNVKDGEHYKDIAELLGGHLNYTNYTGGSAACFSKVAEYLTKVEEANTQGNQFLEVIGSKIVIQYKKLAEHYQKGVEMMLSGDSSEIQRWHDRDCRGDTFDPNWRLDLADNALKKATQAIVIGNESLVTPWNQLASENEKVAELCQRFIEVKLNGNDTEVATWWKIIGAACCNGSADQLDSAAEALEKATAATARGNHHLAVSWIKTAAQYKKSVEYYQKFVEALLNGDNSEADRLQDITYYNSNSAYTLGLATEAFDKSTETRIKGNKSLEELWNKIILKYQESAEYYRKAVKAKLNGNDEEADRWDKAAHPTQDNAESAAKVLELAATALEKATQVAAKGNQSMADLWNKTAIQYQEAAEYYLRSTTEGCYSRNDTETDRWYAIAWSAQNHAEVLELAAKAFEKTTAITAKNNTTLVEFWSKTASQFEKAAAYKQKVTEARLSENETEAEHWDKIADLAKDSALALKSAAEVLEEMTTVRVKVNQPLAKILNKKIAQHQKIAEYYQKVTEARLSETNTDTDHWEKITDCVKSNVYRLEEVAQALEKATQAAAKGKQPLAERWNKIAVQYQEAAEYEQQVTEAKISKNKEEAKNWEQIACCARQIAFKLEKAAEAFEQAMAATVTANQPQAEFWNKTVTQYEKLAESYRKLIEVRLSKNNVEFERWDKILDSAKCSAGGLEKTSAALYKATQAIADNQSPAELWSKIADQYQESAEHYQKAAETRLGGNEAEAERLNEKADATYENAKALQKEAEELAQK